MKDRYFISRFLNTLGIFLVFLILMGAYLYQIITKEDPCLLCHLQRLTMIFITLGPIMNLRYGINPTHYGVALLGCLVGGAISLYQISMHVCPTFSAYGKKVFGIELYTWSFLVFIISTVGTAALLLLYRPKDSQRQNKMELYEKIVIYLLLIGAFLNMITSFLDCGISFHC